MSFRRRTFPEVLDNLLTAIASGVPAEAHPFPPEGANGPPFRHNLQEPPVAEVVSVHGTRYDTTHLFRKNIDYRLSADGSQTWERCYTSTIGRSLPRQS